MQVSIGMLMLLYGVAVQVATGLLGLAFGVFAAAFVAGRNISFTHRRHDDGEEEDEHEGAGTEVPLRAEPAAERREQSLPVGDRTS